MDRRTILFILLVGATFFGLNFYFSYQRDRENREFLAQKHATEAQGSLQERAALEKRKAQLSDLPIVPFSLDPSGEGVVSYAFQTENGLLTLAWSDTLPSAIYAKGKPYQLTTKDAMKGGTVLYTDSRFKALTIATLPDIGIYEVQVVTFSEGEQPQIYVGEVQDGNFQLFQQRLNSNALVFYKSQETWLPLGFYTWTENIFIPLQSLPLLSGLVQQESAIKREGTTSKEQKFYVLENEYQQLVFSTVGGALAEINLPFASEHNKKSVVKEIRFDRDIAKDSPANAQFPARPYYTPKQKEVHATGKVGGYYPLLRRGIWNKTTTEIPPRFYALNVVSEYPEVAELVYTVKEFSDTHIIFEATQPHRKIIKTYSIDKAAPYSFDVDIRIEGDTRGLWITSGVPEVEIMSNNSSPLIQYRLLRGGKSEVEKLSLPKPKEVLSMSSITPDWVVNSNGYMGVILDPLTEIGAGYRAAGILGTQVPTRLSILDPEYHPYPANKYPGYEVLLPLPPRGAHLKMRVFAGPFEEGILKAVDRIYSDPATGYNPDYRSCRTFYGWFSFISKPFAKLLYIVLQFFYSITGSWGFAIILLTVFLRVLLYPLNAWSIKSMRRMQQLSPQIQAIQQRYKKEPKKAQMEIMALYREKKVNPFTGCVPILIQIPFLIAMFDLLKSSFQLRGASFIPGWIDDLTAPDVIFEWNTPIFFIGNQLHLLPLLLGGVMFIQQRYFSAAPADVSKMTDQQRQQRAMSTMMTIVFTVMFYKFPSGLNLYWLSSMLLGILQQWITNRMLDKKKGKVEVEVIADKKFSPKRAK